MSKERINHRSIYDPWESSQDSMPEIVEKKVQRKTDVYAKDYYWEFLKNEIRRLHQTVNKMQQQEDKLKKQRQIDQIKTSIVMAIMTLYFLVCLPYLLGEGLELYFRTSVVAILSIASICFLLFLEFKQ